MRRQAIQTTSVRTGAIVALALWLAITQGAALAGPVEPDYLPLIGTPDALARYWHDQRYVAGDAYACALYAQASVMAALGLDFAEELAEARALGQRDNWFDPEQGAIGLGQPLYANGIRYQSFGSPLDETLTAERALYRLMRELSAGRFAIANVDATRLSYYRGSAIVRHTLWVTGLRLDARGRVTHVITNDSYRGPAVEYPVDEFMAAWASEFNFYAIFVFGLDG